VSGSKNIKAHILVCVHKDCLKQGSKGVWKELKRSLKQHDMRDEVLISKVVCLDQCGEGPVVAVYTNGLWCGSVGEKDAHAIIENLDGKNAATRKIRVLREVTSDEGASK
jgi:NADH:ubiquinone oxidoreductase subunit E